MKKTITSLLFAIVFCLTSLLAQIPNDSPVPVVFKISTASGFQGSYDYASVSGAGWGTDTVAQTVSGQLVWAYDITPDSLCCDSIAADLTGKMALIRRGDCNFSLKMLWAQKAGAIGVVIVNHTYNADGGGLVNMGAGDFGIDVQIPAVFITRDDGDVVKAKVESGEAVTATFEVKPFGTPLHAYAHSTPLTGVIPLSDIGITYINTGTDVLPTVTLTAEIKAPGGNITTLTKVLTDVPALSVNSITFDDSYTPTEVGTYEIHYANSLTPDVFDKSFEVTQFTYAQDNDDIVENTNGTIEPSDDNFVMLYNLNYDFGNYYRTGSQTQVATHVTFILGNPTEIWTGDPTADVFQIRIYDADPDGNGTVPSGNLVSYDKLDESGGTVEPIGQADYILTGKEADFERITAELATPVTLDPNKLYLVMVQYNGLNAGIGIPPKYAFAGTDPVPDGLSSAVFLDSLRTRGWPGFNAVVRLHLDGFTTGTDEVLDNSKIAIAPNPVSDVLRLQLSLEKNAAQVDAHIMDFTGKLVKTNTLENVKEGTYSLNVQDLANGTYFLSVKTPEGYRAKKFVVMR